MTSGSCQCGQIKYSTTEKPSKMTACHCLECRKAFGAPYAEWVGVSRAAVTWIKEPDRIDKSDIAERGYCSSCSSPLSMQYYVQPERISLSAVGMGLPIVDHIFLREQEEGYVIPEDGAARYQEFDPPFQKRLEEWREAQSK